MTGKAFLLMSIFITSSRALKSIMRPGTAGKHPVRSCRRPTGTGQHMCWTQIQRNSTCHRARARKRCRKKTGRILPGIRSGWQKWVMSRAAAAIRSARLKLYGTGSIPGAPWLGQESMISAYVWTQMTAADSHKEQNGAVALRKSRCSWFESFFCTVSCICFA